MPTAAFFSNDPAQIRRVFGEGRQDQLRAELDMYPEMVSQQNFEEHAPHLQDLQYIFSTWGMPALTEEQVARLPALRAVFYAAGSVQSFARPFLRRGAAVVSAWGANAVPVAQFVVAQITLAAKGYFPAVRACRTPQGRAHFTTAYPGLFGTTIALLGAGMVGREVLQLLKPYQLDVLVFDPFLSADRAAELGVKKVTLEEAFERGFVVSNHLADLPETRGMLTRSLFEKLQPNATFINSGRGATVDEAGMLAVFAERPDLTGLLDVTFPEPPAPDSPLYQLENVLLSPHIAGSINHEVLRQADAVIAEFHRLQSGEPLRYAVTLEMLKTMA
jgi:phosphoglycerate dehydrogenase-like enzyme